MTKQTEESRNVADTAVPKSNAMENLSEEEKKALEQEEHAEREIGPKRNHLQEKVQEKAD